MGASAFHVQCGSRRRRSRRLLTGHIAKLSERLARRIVEEARPDAAPPMAGSHR
jgi:hypothetical protein